MEGDRRGGDEGGSAEAGAGDTGGAMTDLLADLARWSSDLRATEAAASRRKQAWLSRQAAEGATWEAVVLELAERRATVAIRTMAGRTHRGRLVAVGGDYVLLAPAQGGAGTRATFFRTSSVATIQSRDGARRRPSGADDRGPTGALASARAPRLADVLTGLCSDRPRVTAGLGSGGTLVGELHWVGADVVGVRLDGDPPTTVTVRLDAIGELSVLG
ncbi:MAG: hypothetical protein ACRD0J_18300 [Acidimicrobiales bacterium]